MEYTIKSFDELNDLFKNEDTLVFVKAKNCGVCDVIYPLIKNICDEYNVDILIIYIEDLKEFTGQYMIFTVPTILIFNYNKEMLRESRFIDQNKIKKYFNTKRELNKTI